MVRFLESILIEIPRKPLHCESSKRNDSTTESHVSLAKTHIQQAIDNLHSSSSDLESDECPELSRLHFIQCQLENSLAPKNRRRYNILTQILSLKTHLISPACYKYLQHMSCLSLPHFNTLEKLYSSFGLESDFFFLKQATLSFSNVKPDISYKGGKIIGPNICPDDPTKTVLAIMVSSLYIKWSCVVRLLPCASLSAEKIFAIVKSCIRDVEACGLFVHIISTETFQAVLS